MFYTRQDFIYLAKERCLLNTRAKNNKIKTFVNDISNVRKLRQDQSSDGVSRNVASGFHRCQVCSLCPLNSCRIIFTWRLFCQSFCQQTVCFAGHSFQSLITCQTEESLFNESLEEKNVRRLTLMFSEPREESAEEVGKNLHLCLHRPIITLVWRPRLFVFTLQDIQSSAQVLSAQILLLLVQKKT